MKNFLSGLCLLLVFGVLSDAIVAVSIAQQIGRPEILIKEPASSIVLKPGQEQKFRLKVRSTHGAFIEFIRFSATGQPKKPDTDSCNWLICQQLEHSFTYKWSEQENDKNHTVTATIKTDSGVYEEHWMVSVRVNPLAITSITPDMPYTTIALNSYETRQSHRVQVGVPRTFEIEATSEDKIASIEFSSKEPKTWFFGRATRDHSESYTWDTVGKQEVTATITTGKGGRTTFTWKVNVVEPPPPNQPPTTKRREPTIRLNHLEVGGRSHTLDMSNYFADPDSKKLTYNKRLGPNSGAIKLDWWLGPSDSKLLIVKPQKAGIATFTVTASDSEYSVEQAFSVMVKSIEPPPTNLPDLIVESISVSPSTLGPGEDFTISATVRNIGTGRAQSSVLHYYGPDLSQVSSRNIPRLSPNQKRKASISLKAPDAPGTYYYDACVKQGRGDEVNKDNNCSTRVAITVGTSVNQVPIVSNTIQVPTLVAGGDSVVVDGSTHFWDSDGDSLTYTAHSDDTNVVTVRVSGADVRITPENAGNTMVHVTASDGTLAATQEFIVLVQPPEKEQPTNHVPSAIGTISPRTLTVDGAAWRVNVANYFDDSDGDRLTYTARSENTNIVTVRVSGNEVIITPQRRVESTRIYVTASDGVSSVTRNFSVSVVAALPEETPVAFDLEILPLSVSKKTITPGGSFTLFVTIRNNGPDTSGSPALSYYQKRTPTDRASFLGTVDVEPLASGESIRKEIEIEIPLNVPSTPITYYYLALLAANTGDTNFSNDHATEVSVTVRSVQAPRVPDLVVESISVNGVVRNQVVLTPGEDFRLDVVVENQGKVDAPSTSLRYYRSLDATLSPDDDEVGSDRITTPDAGQTYDKWERLTAPNTPGTYYYGACVDSVTDESDVNNNCSEAIEITVQTARPPDLVITSVSVDSLDKISLEPGDKFELTAIVENQGEIEVSSTKLRYYLSLDKTISTADEEVDTRNVRALEADDTYEGTKTVRAPDTPGVYYYGACVDSVTGESNLTNNCSAEFIEVTVQALPMPDLIVSVRASKVSLAPRETFTLYATVRNQGTREAGRTILRYHDPTGNEIGTDRIKSLSTTETSDEENIELQAPTAVGTYHYQVCVDSVRNESDVLNNCSVPLTITVGQRTEGVCDRTPEVRDEILAEIDIEDCANVSSADLEEITSLRLSKAGITALKVNDFQGLTSLDDLELLNNPLRSLPVGVFDGLTALFSLELYNNSLSSLPVGVFNELGALYVLDLEGNSLSSLSVGVFNGLSALEHLMLEENSLRSLPVDAFAELSSLRILELNDNSLGSLPVGVFNGLSALETLDLNGNSLSSLPVGVFDGLTALEDLDLSENSLTSLPVGIFDGLDALGHLDLDGNQITTLPEGIFDDILDTLGPSASYVDFDSLKTTFGFSTTTQDAAEGDTVRIVVNLGRALPVAVRVPYTLGGTATTADYTGLQTPTELLFLAGETSKEIVFTLLADADITAETISLTLSELRDVKLRKSDGSGEDAKLSAYALLNEPRQTVHTVTVTTGGEGVSRPMYWTAGDNKIRRSQLDGTQVQVLFEGGNPGDLALDISGGKIYWVDTDLDAILRANLDGSNVVNLITDLRSPTGLALDISGGKIYWLDYNLDKIQRANLNGSGREDLVTGLDRLMRIALDTSGGKMYWTDRGTGKIQRANLNGTNVEDLVTGLNAPRGIALDVSGGKMYWTDTSTNKIQRANLNGTNVEDLVTSIDIGASGLALDVSGGKMYWADNQVDKVCRANLNGSQIERLYAGGYPISIALAIGPGAVHAAPSVVSRNPVLMFPSETTLLPNYPNPFNPDTWIPYQLSKSVDVTVSIYSVDGTLVRTLALGHQPVGIYQNRHRAAYWDGRNAFGESVASGLYFYTLTAGDFTATRKMLIRK